MSTDNPDHPLMPSVMVARSLGTPPGIEVIVPDREAYLVIEFTLEDAEQLARHILAQVASIREGNGSQQG